VFRDVVRNADADVSDVRIFQICAVVGLDDVVAVDLSAVN
jgi:hypothetical protein